MCACVLRGTPGGLLHTYYLRYLVRYLVERMTSSQSVQFLPLSLVLVLVLVYFSFSSAIREKKRGLVGREQESQVYISSSEVQFD